jgi:hypothetical protein
MGIGPDYEPYMPAAGYEGDLIEYVPLHVPTPSGSGRVPGR